jgi:general secretion pathway protein L
VSPSLALTALGRDAWRIWSGQYRDIVPTHIRSWITGAGQDVVVEFGSGTLHVTCGSFSRTFPLGIDPAESTRKALNAMTAFRLFAPRIRLRLPHALCLIRRVAVPPAARHRLAEIVRLDLASGVPMAPEDYFAAHYEDEEGAAAVIVKRRFADESLALLAKAGYPAAALDIWDASGCRPLPVNLLPAPREQHRTRRIAQLLLFAAIAVLGYSLWLSWSQRGEAIAHLDSAIAEARKDAGRVMADAASVNALTEALVAVRKRKAVQPTALAYWEEIARLLPDTGWLSNLTIGGGRIVMTGTSSSSPELIGTLERSPLFADVGFSSPVTFDQAVGADRFTIELALEQAKP